MSLPSEDLVKAVWSAMWEVQSYARRDKVPGPLRDIGKTANRLFEDWLTRRGALQEFAACGLLCGPVDLRANLGATAC